MSFFQPKNFQRIFWGALLATAAQASQLILPSPVLDRDGLVTVTYQLDAQITGRGQYSVKWTDSLGRVVEDRTEPVELHDEDQFTLTLDLGRAVAMKNTVRVHLSLDGHDLKQQRQHKEEDVQADFVARPSGPRWRDYVITMWQQYPAELIPELEKLGINAGQYSGRHGTLPESFIDRNLRWYSEGIGTEFYSAYHQWRRDRPYQFDLLQAKELLKKNPSSKEPFKRHPSLWDFEYRKIIHDRLVNAAKNNSPYRPIFYSLSDEAGIGDLAGFWDFDFSDESLVPMRRWLRKRYGTLPALNREWGTNYESWNDIIPPTTHEAMQRSDDNFAAWADFKEWMDISFADALKAGADAIHEVDPDAYVGLGGGQMPGWGGYDYARLTKALTMIEPYDIGSNIEIIRSLNPEMPMVTTGFANGKWEKQRVWYELFHNNRGLIIWDEKQEYVGRDRKPGQRGLEAASYYNELRDGIAAQIINSEARVDPIAIHYSQPSMRTQWMLARKGHNDDWITRSAKEERSDNDFLRLRESWCRLIEDQGLQYNFVSYQQMEQGELIKRGYRIVVLPQSSSLSEAEVRELREFVNQGGVVIADGEPGTFNEHSRRLAKSALADLFDKSTAQPVSRKSYGKGEVISLHLDTLNYHQNRVIGKEAAVHQAVGKLLASLGVKPAFAVTDRSGNPVVGVETHVYQNGGVRIIALNSNPQLRVDELGPPDFRSNERFEKPVDVTLTLPESMHVYDMRKSKAIGKTRTLNLTVDPYEPIVLAVNDMPLPGLRVSLPAEMKRGSTLDVGIDASGSPAATHIFHVDVMDPEGVRALNYSGNIFAEQGYATKRVPFAFNDSPGKWTVAVHDLLSGEKKTVSVTVN
jgi:hypothetical protein